MATTINYKGSTIASFTNTTKTLKTAGKYMEGDVAVTESISLQSKTVTPTTSAQTVTADSGYEGLGTVTVGPADSGATIIWDEEDSHGGTIRYISTGNVISGTSTITSNGIYNVAAFASASVMVQPTLQSKTITPTETAQNVIPDSGYHGLSKVTVNAINSNYVGTNIARKASGDVTFASATGTFTAPIGYYSSAATKTIATKAAATIYPTTTNQTINSYQWLTGSQTIKGDANLVASNIADGVSIFGVSGTHTGGIPHTLMHYGLNSKKYIKYKNKYYSNGNSSFTFLEGEELTLYLQASSSYLANQIRIDSLVYQDYTTESLYTYSYILPGRDITVSAAISNSINQLAITTLPSDYDFLYKGYGTTFYYTPTMNGFASYINGLTTISAGQFAGRTFSGEFYFPYVSVIYTKGFHGIVNLGGAAVPSGAAYFHFPKCRTVSDYAFYMNHNISAIDAPECTTIEISAFESCGRLASVSFPKCTSIKSYAFCRCVSLTSAYFPECVSIGSYTFSSCIRLEAASFPKCTVIPLFAFGSCRSLTTLSFPVCTSIGQEAFANCAALSSVFFPECTIIAAGAFSSCGSLATLSFPECTSIGSSAFFDCPSLVSISFPKCTYIGTSAFGRDTSLTTVFFPECVSIARNAFDACYKLESVSLPKCTIIGSSAFANCSSLATIYFPECLVVSSWAFYQCSGLTTVSLPKCTTFSKSIFAFCYNIISVSLPCVTSIYEYQFQNVYELSTVFISDCLSMGIYAFQNCRKLLSFYMLGNSVTSMPGTNVFVGSPISNNTTYTGGVYGSIFVKQSLLTDYLADGNWGAFSSRIVGLTDTQVQNVLTYGRHDP